MSRITLPRFPVDTRKRPEPTVVPKFLLPIRVKGVDIPDRVLVLRNELRSLASSEEIYAIMNEGDNWVILQAVVDGKLNAFKLPMKYVKSHIPISGSCS